MALVEQAVRLMTKKLPKVISPRTHAIIDYAMIGTFILMGSLFWKKNRKAAIAAFSFAAAEANIVLLTDFPGGVTDVIRFETHGRIDRTLAVVTAILPDTLNFGDEPEAQFFRIQGVALGAVTSMTEFTPEQRESKYHAA
ncbi:MAG TPA: hypothetical protein VG649_13380 [Candidatus Angelobacter sp.]|jgi:hypothetical protein|nr:hypothetical protein [Candidatus Angelobacter sp.]